MRVYEEQKEGVGGRTSTGRSKIMRGKELQNKEQAKEEDGKREARMIRHRR